MEKKELKKRALYNILLVLTSFIYIFIIGLFGASKNQTFAYQLLISIIYFLAFLTIKEESRYSFTIPVVMILLTWLGFVFHLPLLAKITGFIATVFFFGVIVMLILRIAKSSRVGVLEFIESVNIYLLLGIAAAVLFRLVWFFHPDAYNTPPGGLSGMSDFIYFAFVTMSTLGYGDISPATPMARSLAVFFSVAGQLYLTMIIAMLVGKYLNAATGRK